MSDTFHITNALWHARHRAKWIAAARKIQGNAEPIAVWALEMHVENARYHNKQIIWHKRMQRVHG